MKKARFRKKIYVSIAVVFILLLVIVAGASVFMFHFALDRKTSLADAKLSYQYLSSDTITQQWIDSVKIQDAIVDTFIVAKDGTRLHALYVYAPDCNSDNSNNTAILIHGYTDNAIRMLMIGQIYSRMGYNILLPDLRAHGLSEGEYIQMGWNDRKDIISWIDVSKHLFGDSTNVVLHGISMGAAAAMMTAGDQNLQPNVKCIVEDCGYTSVWDEYKHEMKKRYGLPAFPILYVASWYTNYKTDWDFAEASSIEQLKKQNLPVFFIHGGADTYVPTSMVYELYDAQKGEKELWVADGVAHAQMYWKHRDEYIQRTRDFVSKYMK